MGREQKRINSGATTSRHGAAIRYDAPGDTSVLRLEEVEFAAPGAGEVLIAVDFAGVNRPDLLQRAGLYPPPAGQNPHLGLEVSGTVAACGTGVHGYEEGDRVFALTNGGGYAAFVSVPCGQVMRLPGSVPAEAGAGMAETALTVFANVFDGADDTPRSLLIHGGASGIGTMGIAMARAVGWRVHVTARSRQKHALLSDMGAAGVFHPDDDWDDTLREEGGVDVVLDMIGAEGVARNLRVLKPEGRLAFIAFLGGSRVSLDLMPVMLKRLQITGSTLRSRSSEEKARLAGAFMARFGGALAEGALTPRIDRVFDLGEAGEAHRYLDTGQHVGKVVLRVAKG